MTFDEMRKLGSNWDGYGAVPIDPRAIQMAIDMIYILPGTWEPIPCADGSVQLERHAGGFDLELMISVAETKHEPVEVGLERVRKAFVPRTDIDIRDLREQPGPCLCGSADAAHVVCPVHPRAHETFDARTGKCSAIVPARWHTPEHLCPFDASTEADGKSYCGIHAPHIHGGQGHP